MPMLVRLLALGALATLVGAGQRAKADATFPQVMSCDAIWPPGNCQPMPGGSPSVVSPMPMVFLPPGNSVGTPGDQSRVTTAHIAGCDAMLSSDNDPALALQSQVLVLQTRVDALEHELRDLTARLDRHVTP